MVLEFLALRQVGSGPWICVPGDVLKMFRVLLVFLQLIIDLEPEVCDATVDAMKYKCPANKKTLLNDESIPELMAA